MINYDAKERLQIFIEYKTSPDDDFDQVVRAAIKAAKRHDGTVRFTYRDRNLTVNKHSRPEEMVAVLHRIDAIEEALIEDHGSHIEYSYFIGGTIAQAVRRMLEIRDTKGKPVKIEFNDKIVWAKHGDDADSVVKSYWEQWPHEALQR